jgi:hypothetical protein
MDEVGAKSWQRGLDDCGRPRVQPRGEVAIPLPLHLLKTPNFEYYKCETINFNNARLITLLTVLNVPQTRALVKRNDGNMRDGSDVPIEGFV